MAVLNEAQRAAVWAHLMQLLSDARETCAITKTQLRAAVDAADDWADTNAPNFNNALPTAAKNNLTSGQKAMLLAYVVLKRYTG